MRRLLLLLCFPAVALGADRPAAHAIPELPSASGGALEQKGLALAPDTAQAWMGRVALSRQTLVLKLSLIAPAPTSRVTVSMRFPRKGPAESARSYRFGVDGKRAPLAEDAVTSEEVGAVAFRSRTDGANATLELGFPPTTWPAYPAHGAAGVDLCIELERPGQSAVRNCHGTAADELALPKDFRPRTPTKVPRDVEALEARPKGFLGYGKGPEPVWAAAEAALDPGALATLLGPGWTSPQDQRIASPKVMTLPGGGKVVPLVREEPSSGTPISGPAAKLPSPPECADSASLRFLLFLLKGNSAVRVLDWPASSCTLGRATSLELDEEGALTIGYSSGELVHFSWSRDHFERTELGER